MPNKPEGSPTSRALANAFMVILALLLGGGVAIVADTLYFRVGLREVGRAPEGFSWLSSGGEYGRVSAMVMLLLVLVLGLVGYGVLRWVQGRVPALPKEEETLALIGCLPLAGGCAVVTFLLTLGRGG